jgi:hypothetical protein
MIDLTVRGARSEKKRKLTIDVAAFALKKLMPRKKELFIEFTYKNVDGAEGYCLHIDKDMFEIEIDHKMKDDDLITCILHEMVHVKQYCRSELIQEDESSVWMKEVWPDDDMYPPWEREAYQKQEELLKAYHAR